jgi:hypothetical protein
MLALCPDTRTPAKKILAKSTSSANLPPVTVCPIYNRQDPTNKNCSPEKYSHDTTFSHAARRCPRIQSPVSFGIANLSAHSHESSLDVADNNDRTLGANHFTLGLRVDIGGHFPWCRLTLVYFLSLTI